MGIRKKLEEQQIGLSEVIKHILLTVLQTLLKSLPMNHWEYFIYGCSQLATGTHVLSTYPHPVAGPLHTPGCGSESKLFYVASGMCSQLVQTCRPGIDHKLELQCQIWWEKKRYCKHSAWCVAGSREVTKKDFTIRRSKKHGAGICIEGLRQSHVC